MRELKLEDGSILILKPIIARPELAFIIATRAILGARRSGRPSPSSGWSRQFLPSVQFSASASKSVDGREFLRPPVSASSSLRRCL